MASIKERNGKYCLIYGYRDKTGKTKQKWETYSSKAEALKRKTEVEYKTQQGIFVVPQCKILKDLLAEYVSLYGKERWALKTYETNTGLINNYILPYIGNVKVSDINTRFLEKFYQDLQNKPAVIHPYLRCEEQKTVGPSRIRDVHRLLRSCFNQAVKWELIEKNPAINATVPKYAQESREVWDSDALMEALNQSDDPILTLAINLTFSCTLRVGEMLGLTWDCVDITEESLEKGFCSVYINKELQRVTKDAVQALNSKDIISVFPEIRKTCRSVRVLKKPKTESSIRKVYLPQTVARMLVSHKEEQENRSIPADSASCDT